MSTVQAVSAHVSFNSPGTLLSSTTVVVCTLPCYATLCNTGHVALGKTGQYLVAGFALSEFFGGGCMMLIVMWRIVMDTLPDQGITPSPHHWHYKPQPVYLQPHHPGLCANAVLWTRLPACMIKMVHI